MTTTIKLIQLKIVLLLLAEKLDDVSETCKCNRLFNKQFLSLSKTLWRRGRACIEILFMLLLFFPAILFPFLIKVSCSISQSRAFKKFSIPEG